MKNFEKFFDVHMDTSVIVDNIKKNFKIFNFLAKEALSLAPSKTGIFKWPDRPEHFV